MKEYRLSEDTKNAIGWGVSALVIGFLWLCPFWMSLAGWI